MQPKPQKIVTYGKAFLGKIPITTTIDPDFKEWLDENDTTLAKWIVDHQTRDRVQAAVGVGAADIRAITARLNEQCGRAWKAEGEMKKLSIIVIELNARIKQLEAGAGR